MPRKASLYEFEKKHWREGLARIAGVDEAGRGPLAGPVVAAAVVLPAGKRIPGLNDSKQLSHEERESLFARILELAEVGVGLVSETVIDEINIYQASRLSMKQAIEALPSLPEAVLVDGRMHLDVSCPATDIIHGDALSASIGAASIVAKVTRDHIMMAYHELAPRFSFHIHKGYGTPAHLAALAKFGPSEFHRRSFRPIRKEPEPLEPLLK